MIGVKFKNGNFYNNKPTAFYLDPYQQIKTQPDQCYIPLKKMIYVEFNDYDDFARKKIYKYIFRKLTLLKKSWKDLNYATKIEYKCNYYDDYNSNDSDEYNSNDSDEYDDSDDPDDYVPDDPESLDGIIINFGVKKLRNLEKYEYKINTILFGFSIDLKHFEKNPYEHYDGLKTLTHKKPIDLVYWCGIPYSEGSMIGNFCTFVSYDPKLLTFGIDGECG